MPRTATTQKPRDLVVEVLRDWYGKAFSQVRDRNAPPVRSVYLSRSLVVDREKGRQYTLETIQNRAQSLAELLGVPYEEDLTWPCRAKQGWDDCQCPDCRAKVDARARGRR